MKLAARTHTALFAAFVFIVAASPRVFKVVDGLLGAPLGLRLASYDGRPTRLGLVLHAALVFGLVYAYGRT